MTPPVGQEGGYVVADGMIAEMPDPGPFADSAHDPPAVIIAVPGFGIREDPLRVESLFPERPEDFGEGVI
ncbi:hypothetical protein [Desulfobacca acetoxidans]|uniref:hypothetical protein n=1 Tax=Desulfobacca acetoxidans TaxID=60893 RepID=UPI00059CBE3C|nr:hypothetical protein [Desulfobacca acetoxidans]